MEKTDSVHESKRESKTGPKIPGLREWLEKHKPPPIDIHATMIPREQPPPPPGAPVRPIRPVPIRVKRVRAADAKILIDLSLSDSSGSAANRKQAHVRQHSRKQATARKRYRSCEVFQAHPWTFYDAVPAHVIQEMPKHLAVHITPPPATPTLVRPVPLRFVDGELCEAVNVPAWMQPNFMGYARVAYMQ